ncbi:MAG: class I SAM-dependent methyltransferase [Thermoproteota archaeon]|nr:class I SAM-dependent methyltransferase [Thermoproteota archaeon]
MTYIKKPYNKFVFKLQESFLVLGAKKRIQFMTQHIDIMPGDILLDVGGNAEKITQAYARDCKEIVVLDPKHAVVEYGRKYRPHIKFVEGGAEKIPSPGGYFDKVVASASFHHFPYPDRGLEEMKRVLKPNGKMIIMEIDPNTGNGKWLKICEGMLHTGAKFYEPLQLRKKVEEHGLKVLSVNSTTLGYFLTATKVIQE